MFLFADERVSSRIVMKLRLETIILCAAAWVVAAAKDQSFVTEPEDETAIVDGVVTLPCRVADLAGQLQWTKDDFALGTNRNLSYHGYPRYAMTGSDENGKSTIIHVYIVCL